MDQHAFGDCFIINLNFLSCKCQLCLALMRSTLQKQKLSLLTLAKVRPSRE